MDEENNVHIVSRTDDIINVAGHRLATSSIEEVLSSHPSVAECCVFGVKDEIKGQHPLGLIILKEGKKDDPKLLKKELVNLVREHLGPVYSFKNILVVKQLPKTRSGKILRGTLKKIADQEEYSIPATIDDPQVLKDITKFFEREGIFSV